MAILGIRLNTPLGAKLGLCRSIIYSKEAAASEAAGQTKEEFSGNDASRHPKVLKVGPKLGCQ